jgi:hypothetical protein
MSDMKPWLYDDVPPEIGRLLRAARSYSPPPSAIHRAVLMLGSAAAVGTATTSVLGTVTKAGTTSLAWATKWGATTLLGIGLGTPAAVTARYYSADTRPVATAAPAKPKAQSNRGRARSPSVAREELSPPFAEANPSGTEPRPAAPTGVPVVLPQPAVVKHADDGHADAPAAMPAGAPSAAPSDRQAPAALVTPAPPQNAPEDRLLAEEMRYLDQARGALRQSRPNEALEWLEVYRRNCAVQRMLPEALLLRLRAEMSAGNRSAALATARQIGVQFPESPHAARARELIAAEHFE